MNKEITDISNILSKTIVVGLSYFDKQNNPLNQSQITGTVVEVHEQDGITILLSDKKREFTIPSDLSSWSDAPSGRYHSKELNDDIEDPDYLVNWDIYQKQNAVSDNNPQWWDWVPRTSSPEVQTPPAK